ncbi:MAG: tRNA preQ1(34) S-adenosylmethionine ribosyltransferase-isomerase QueA [Desulfosarcinaceae bacterium]|nr:tRNA preQ1(34) S-adenosylmethionine ribosyltransferase-isomerase QueA [Desulfosarcinaceae bacterium]
MYRRKDYAYELPERLIAQHPVPDRKSARLLHLRRGSGALRHHRFADLPALLASGDLLVVNNTAVVPGRLFGRKPTGGKVEVLLLDYHRGDSGAEGGRIHRCMVRSSKPVRPGMRLRFDPRLHGDVLDAADGIATLRFHCDADFEALLSEIGHVPLPPYIKRDSVDRMADRQDYQTVYAAHKGAIAAPTAGLHFTTGLLDRLAERGIAVAQVTLHVGYGTFVPVRVNDIRDHRMHAEWYRLGSRTAATINRAKAEGRRVVAVGTTAVRTLEASGEADGRVRSGSGECDLFIYPGYQFKVVDALITNFHLPESTLLMLVAALAGREQILAAYRAAVAAQYRFFSYGDAMLIT